MAKKAGRYVAGALNLVGARHALWPQLGLRRRFSRSCISRCCYYRAIDFAIAHGLKRVEAGAQGQHKIQRGYLPTPTYSAHWIRDPGFARAVADFVTRERTVLESEMEQLEQELSPFKREAE